MSDLPQGWTLAEMPLVCDKITDGTHHSPVNLPSGEFKYVTAKNIRPWGLDLTNISYVDAKTHHEIYARCPVNKGDVLYIKDGATTGLAIVNPLDEPFSMLSSVALLKPSRAVLESSYLKFWLNSPDTLSMMLDRMTGTAIRRLTLTTISAQKIPLAPLPEQRRIVAKVDGLTARTARARKELDRILTLIARYKQRLLAQAFNGELIGKRPASGEAFDSGCWDVPTSWHWKRFVDVAEIASNLVKPESIPDLPHIAPDNIEAGTARLLPYRTIAEDKLISAKNRFYPGQVLYSKIRPYLKKAVLIDFDGACSADMYPIRAGPGLHSKYLLYWLISDSFAQFSARHEGRTVLPKINQKALNATPFPLPPKEDQIEIVRRIESAFGWLDRMAADHAAAARLLPKLDATILAKAFRGELVPQDPNDEPADVLLDRIKMEREAEGKKVKSGRGRKPNGSKAMTEKPLLPREQLLKDSEKWPADGLPFEAIAMRNPISHDALRDALFDLLSGSSPVLQQRFDADAEAMVIQRVAA